MHNLTPIASLLGGVLIGLSASAMLLLNGKIAGISGILAGVLKPVRGDTLWRGCFLSGLLVGVSIEHAHVLTAVDPGLLVAEARRSRCETDTWSRNFRRGLGTWRLLSRARAHVARLRCTPRFHLRYRDGNWDVRSYVGH